MYTLYQALLTQHSRQLTPVRCAEQTIAQLHRYFEDVVLENNLAALVIESLPLTAERSLRDLARVREVGRAARKSFFFVSPGDALNDLPLRTSDQDREPVLLKRPASEKGSERFVVIADARFSAMLASIHGNDEDDSDTDGDRVIWTFEPDVVYSALEYLMARVTAEGHLQAPAFTSAVRSSMPKATSLQLTVGVTTKLARLLQEQGGREIAVNRIATAIRNSLELNSVLQTTVNEVGKALNAQHCALRIEGEAGQPPLTPFYFRDGAESENAEEAELSADLDAYSVRLAGRYENYVMDGRGELDANSQNVRPLAAVRLIYKERFMGVLLVRSDDSTRIWQENELLLLETVADQVTVAVSHARLYAQVQQQALTDGLTGLYNRRQFEAQLEKELHMATRLNQPLSVILLDLDKFKLVNDRFGHEKGDAVLRRVADVLRAELRAVDTPARYGGEEFAVILFQAGIDGAVVVAERLRERIAEMEVPGVDPVTASLGIASFTQHGTSRDTIILAADRALYEAKDKGRNRVRVAPDVCAVSDEPAPTPEEDTLDGTRDEDALHEATSPVLVADSPIS